MRPSMAYPVPSFLLMSSMVPLSVAPTYWPLLLSTASCKPHHFSLIGRQIRSLVKVNHKELSDLEVKKDPIKTIHPDITAELPGIKFEPGINTLS